MIKNIIFDLDGTVIDSSECIYTVYSALFKEIDVPMPKGRQKRRLIGPPVETTLKGFSVDPSYSVRFREIYQTVDLKKTNRLYDGIPELFENLTEKGYRLFIATSKSEAFAVKILKYLNVFDYFEAVYGSRADLNRSDKCDVLDAVIGDIGLDKEECVLVGDTVFDAEGAEKAGIKIAIVTYGFGEAGDFDGKDILFFADSPSDISEKIKEYNNG